MTRFTVLALATISLLVGCSSPSTDGGTAGEPTPKSTAVAPGDGNVAFRNEEGRLLCPVMKVVIASEKDAVAFQDYEGVRYYFCCSMCPPKFKADPAKYAKK